ncbi:uncharacterized protein LOC134769612 [Penaeus indicus]|uniref:uncharacterized protein LOC134769612 n=1 Tax=Penaeus indicus TaxID=29960 RepID=UPI00300DBC30
MGEEIDTERLISLVQERPVLWDKTEDIYKDRNATKNAWKEVCMELKPDFEELEDREKNTFGKDVMKRWTNVRDCYAKFNKKTKEAKKSGAGACKVKSYIYSKELQFLSKLYEERDTQDSFDGPGTCEEEHDRGASSDPLPSRKSSSGASDVGRKRSRKLDPFEEQMLKIMEDDAKNRHMSFFRSVLPSLEKFDDDEVLKFQMDVLQSISKIKEGKLRKTTTHNVLMFSPSGGSPYPTFWQHQSYPPHTSLPPPAPHHHSQTSRFPNAAQPGHVSGDFQGYEQQMSSSYADNAVSPTPTQFSNDSIDFTS